MQKAGREWRRGGRELVENWRRDGGELAESWQGAGWELVKSSQITWGKLAEKSFLLSLKVSWRKAGRVLSKSW